MIDAGITVNSDCFIVLSSLNGQGICCGLTLSAESKISSWLSRSINSYYDKAGVLNARVLADSQEILYAPTCNLVIPKRALSIRFLDAIFTDAGFEDVEYCLRCKMILETPITFHRALKVQHHFRTYSLEDFERRYRRYGRNHVKFYPLVHTSLKGFRDFIFIY